MSASYSLVIRQFGGCGDALCLLPVLQAIKEKFPDDELHVVSNSRYMNGGLDLIWERSGLVDKVHDVFPWEFTTKETISVQNPACKHAEDIMALPVVTDAARVFDLNNACIVYEMAHMPKVDKTRTQIWANHAGVDATGIKATYRVTPEERQIACDYVQSRGWDDGKPLVGVSVTSRASERGLSKEQAWDIAQGLKGRGCRPVFVGNDWECPGFDNVAPGELRHLFALVGCLDAMVCVDSAPLHVAGVLGVPIVGLFGPTDPRMRMQDYVGIALDSRNLVPCAHCWYDRPCLSKEDRSAPAFACMTRIDAGTVVEGTLRLLASRSLA